jgi:hypothetical protein
MEDKEDKVEKRIVSADEQMIVMKKLVIQKLLAENKALKRLLTK